jgi:hypothetical protein
VIQRAARVLTRPRRQYQLLHPNDLANLRGAVRKGDVVLVDGDQRVSEVIKYLTQSSWSHAALYIGDELLRHDEPLRAEALACFGDDARHVLIEALLDGVVASPLSKYADLNVRICRPVQLKPHDLKTILAGAIRSLGWRYDLRNVVDLMRYLLPVSLVPSRFRRTALHFGSGVPTEVICSSHIGQLFQSVGFPIAPTVEPQAFDAPAGRASPLRFVFGHESADYTGLFRQRHPTLLTPRDFDLSPYFDIVKFNPLARGDFDYSRMQWEEAAAPAAAIGDGAPPRAAAGSLPERRSS